MLVPGCYDALSARVLETVGFPLLYMTGFAHPEELKWLWALLQRGRARGKT